MVENNPHKISTMGTADGSSLAAITDASDFPHTGLIKGLSLMARQNIVVKGSNDSATHDFNITQATSGNVIQVAQGSYLRDSKLYTASAANFTIGTTSNDTSLLAHSEFDAGYHLLVINSSNVIKIRQPSADNKVPDYTAGDTIIAIIEITSVASKPDGSRLIQYLTSDKTDNSVSIAYTASNTYTETMSIIGDGDRTTFKNKIANADIRFILADNTADEKFEILTDDDSDGDEGDTSVFSIDGLGAIAAGNLTYDQDDLILSSAAAQLQVKDTTNNYAVTVKGGGGPRLQFGDTDSSVDGFMDIGSYGGVNNIDTQSRDFRIHGTNADPHLYIDESAANVGIGVAPITNSKLTVEGVLALDEVSAPTNTADYGQLYANADNDLHYMDGAGTDTPLLKGGKHTIWVPSSAMTPLTTNGCSALTQVEMTAGRPELQVLDFAAGADDFCQFTVAFPKSWNEGTVTFQPFWTVTGTNTGTAVWELTGIGANDNYAIDSGYPSVSATGAKAHSGTSNDLNVSDESGALTITNASVDSVTFFRLNLKTSASSQTGAVRLIGLKLFYDINAGNDE
jgi:hypothetical protein